MKKIVIFSTKYIDDGNCLFSEGSYRKCGNKMVTKHLLHYFSQSLESFENRIKGIGTNIEILDKISKLFSERLPNKYELVQKRIQNLTNDSSGRNLNSLIQIIKTNGLQTEIEAIIGETKEMMYAQKRSENFYKLKDLDVYAIPCLEDQEKEKADKEWIPTLLKCAKEIANESDNSNEEIDLLLVLHDKDLKKYSDKNLYIITKEKRQEELKLLLGEIEITCKIVFFQHTVNKFAKILKQPLEEGRNIYDEIVSAINNYEAIDPIKGKYSEAISAKQNVLEQLQKQDELLINALNAIEPNKINQNIEL